MNSYWLSQCLPYVTWLSVVTCVVLSPTSCPAQSFPDSVKEINYGRNSGFGSDFFPGNVLGPPRGTADASIPNFSRADLLSLGTGGSIILEFSTNRITDGPGPDLTIFENPVQPNGYPEQTFADTAVVAVSDDGLSWFTFPFDMISSEPAQLRQKSNYIGLAGVQPSHSSPENGISPFDPAVSGGDKFDLSTVALSYARFVRITDSGEESYSPSYDLQNDIVNDYGNAVDPDPTVPGSGTSAGFDLDAIAAIHSEPYNPSAVVDWQFYD